MWGGRERGRDQDGLLTESLLRQLSHTVKEVQLHHSQFRETSSAQDGTSSLVTVLEAIFLHGLKRSILESALKSVSVTEDSKPKSSFYAAVKPVTHKDTLSRIEGLKRITTDVGRSRVWVRLALNEAAVSSYLAVIATDRRFARFYRPTAFLRNKEALDTAARLIDGLLAVTFDIPLNSSVLDTWTSEPLLLSGQWTPAIRDSVKEAYDVAGGIEEEEETGSLMTASSSVRSLLMIDEAQILQIILDAPILQEELEPEESAEPSSPTEEDPVGRLALERSFSTLMESCSPQPESFIEQANQDEVTTTPSDNQEDPTQQVEAASQPTQPKIEEDDFNNLFTGTSKQDDTERLAEELAKRGEGVEPPVGRGRSLEETVRTIARESGLKSQRFKCADCQLSIGLNLAPAALCHVTGQHLCEQCHGGELGVVPARLIYNWDHVKYPTGRRATAYLTAVQTEPIFDLEAINPKLYNVVPELQEMLRIRRQLNLLNVYLTTCKEPLQLSCRKYLLDKTHVYSLTDLAAIPGGGLKAELTSIVALARGHVVTCWMCKQKGFICELCRNSQVIYPFDAGSVYRCSKCKAVYHGQCLSRGTSCPKCQRRKRRELERRDEIQ